MLICPRVYFLTFFPNDFSYPCCTHSFDLQTFSSSSINALPCSTFKVLARRVENSAIQPTGDLHTLWSAKVTSGCWGQPSL